MIRKNYPKMIATKIVGVQPMGSGVSEDPEPKWSKWRRTISFWPRRSINGKLIFGRIHTSWRNDWGIGVVDGPKHIWRYATDKELFTAKLKGET